MQVGAAYPADAERRQQAGGSKAGAVHHGIHRVRLPVCGLQYALLHGLYRLLHQLHLRLGEGREVVIGHEHAFAAYGIARREGIAQLRVTYLRPQHAFELPLAQPLQQKCKAGKAQPAQLVLPINAPTVEAL